MTATRLGFSSKAVVFLPLFCNFDKIHRYFTVIMSNHYKLALLAGDGIGPEIMSEAVKILQYINTTNLLHFEFESADFGAEAYFKHGHPFPEVTKQLCDQADIIMKGPIGLDHAKSMQIPTDMRPERAALLPLRERYQTFANYRPIYLPRSIVKFSPLKANRIQAGVDILMVRELCGGLYFGKKQRGVNTAGFKFVNEQLEYDENQIRNVTIQAFEIAQKRSKKIHHIHKSNVLMSSLLWVEIVEQVAKDFPDVALHHMLVDAAATHLCLNPAQFDVMLMENMFGDILSDQGGGLLGSLGLMPSACIGAQKSYYEPSHGSAPDIAGKQIANPYSMIASVAMMLEYSCLQPAMATKIWQALEQVYLDGFATADLKTEDDQVLSTAEFGDKVLAKLEQL